MAIPELSLKAGQRLDSLVDDRNKLAHGQFDEIKINLHLLEQHYDTALLVIEEVKNNAENSLVNPTLNRN